MKNNESKIDIINSMQDDNKKLAQLSNFKDEMDKIKIIEKIRRR